MTLCEKYLNSSELNAIIESILVNLNKKREHAPTKSNKNVLFKESSYKKKKKKPKIKKGNEIKAWIKMKTLT